MMIGPLFKRVSAALGWAAGGISTLVYPSVCRVCKVELAAFEGPYFCGACGATIDAGLLTGGADDYRVKPVYLRSEFRAYACFPYAGAAEAAVRLLKYEGKTILARALGAAVGKIIRTLGGEDAFDVAVSVPLHRRRLRERGFDQSWLIMARAVGGGDIPRAFGGVLQRVRDTVPQVTLEGAARLRNITGAFAADKAFFRGRRVLLIDDVITTGATVGACAEAIEEAGGSVAAAVAFAAPGSAENAAP